MLRFDAMQPSWARLFLPLLVPLLGCDAGATASDGAGGGATTVLHPNAPPLPGETECTVTIQTGIHVPAATHVPICTPVAYATNPPCGGPHWPVWAAFGEYATPVPRPMYVHDMEHGAVLLAYRCAAGCPDVVAALEHVRATTAPDPKCAGTGTSARVVLTPDPELATPIAAAAWGATYTATCIDEASLSSFAAEVYGKAPEDFCSPGLALGDGGTGCGDGG